MSKYIIKLSDKNPWSHELFKDDLIIMSGYMNECYDEVLKFGKDNEDILLLPGKDWQKLEDLRIQSIEAVNKYGYEVDEYGTVTLEELLSVNCLSVEKLRKL
jgi:hypothetical protein